MVILFSGRKSVIEKEIIKILTSFGANYISDKKIKTGGNLFTIISEYKPTEINIKNGIVIFIDDTDRFESQILPENIIGICENQNIAAKEAFKNSKTPVIICGMNTKCSITLSSLGSNYLFVSLQRSITNFKGEKIEPFEFKIKLTAPYHPFSVMASATVLLLNGIVPEVF